MRSVFVAFGSEGASGNGTARAPAGLVHLDGGGVHLLLDVCHGHAGTAAAALAGRYHSSRGSTRLNMIFFFK